MANPKITTQHVLAATFMVEFEAKVYFRIEILRAETKQMVENTTFIAEVYMLCWPNGQMAIPSGPRVDTRFRQAWLYLDDFPAVSASSVDGTRDAVMARLLAYAGAYLVGFDTGLKRGRPAL